MLAYGIDIGGSSIKHGLVEVTDRTPTLVSLGTPVPHTTRDFAELHTNVITILEEVLASHPTLCHVGISTAGGVDHDGTMISSSKFTNYAKVSWRHLLQERFPQLAHISVHNDGKASAWGEYSTSDPAHRSHLHIVVGTGVGGGVIDRRQLVLGHHGYAGYIGHTKVLPNPTRACCCGALGCVETASSAHGILGRFNELSSEPLHHFREVIEAAMHEDTHALQALEEGGYWLGVAITNAMTLLNPGVVTLGGGVIDATSELGPHLGKDIYWEQLLQVIQKTLHPGILLDVDVRKGQHGNDGGVIGAACLSTR